MVVCTFNSFPVAVATAENEAPGPGAELSILSQLLSSGLPRRAATPARLSILSQLLSAILREVLQTEDLAHAFNSFPVAVEGGCEAGGPRGGHYPSRLSILSQLLFGILGFRLFLPAIQLSILSQLLSACPFSGCPSRK